MDQVDRVAIEKVRRVDVGFDPESDPGSLETPAGQLLTGDHNIVNVRATLNYTISEEQVENYVAQIDVLETMTPLQFTSFRDRLESASGFQSAQFREVEAVLGRRDASAVAAQPEGSAARARIEAAQGRRSVWGSFLRFLVARGHGVAEDVLARDVALTPAPDERVQDVLLAVYHDDADAALVAERLVDLDEGFQEWRYRHVKMVERTIGTKRGTGGSAGVEYLRTTLFQPVFPDLWEIRGRL
jgi:tryptophan 2,3-dioxygenase